MVSSTDQLASVSQLSMTTTNGAANVSPSASYTMEVDSGVYVNVGAVVSTTSIVCVAEVAFPQSSVAMYVLTIVMDCGHEPGTISSNTSTVTAPQASEAVYSAAGAGSSHSMVTSEAMSNNGDVVSCWVMVCTAELELPHASTAVKVLVMTYAPPHAPCSYTSSTSTVTSPHWSVAVAMVPSRLTLHSIN